jgi:integrase
VVRRVRSQKFETRSARAGLAPRPKPYRAASLARGITLLYRRNKKPPHPWIVKVADGHSGHWIRNVAFADDYEDANGDNVLNYQGAIEAALTLARGGASDSGKPATWAAALDDYEADLRARDGDPINASRVRHHLPPALMSKPVALLTAAELKRWRNDLVESGIAPGTAVRVLKAARASLNMAADHDPGRIPNRNAWKVGLAGLTDSYSPVNRVLPDADVLRIVTEAYRLDPHFGLFIDVLAATGTRTSQAAGLRIRDLQADNGAPRLLMPSSRKGGKGKKIARTPVPIPPSLSQKLARAAGDRDPDEPLLVRADGRPWDPKKQELRNLFADAAKRAGIGGTVYQLRHSYVVRSLINGVPLRVVASIVDSSSIILESVYSRYIADHGDTVARKGLLDTDAALTDDKVVTLPTGR